MEYVCKMPEDFTVSSAIWDHCQQLKILTFKCQTGWDFVIFKDYIVSGHEFYANQVGPR